jgi:hypothetical protein
MPLVADATRKWQRAVAAAQRANNPVNTKSVAVAATNLNRALQNLGVNGNLVPIGVAKNPPAFDPSQPSEPVADDTGGFTPVPQFDPVNMRASKLARYSAHQVAASNSATLRLGIIKAMVPRAAIAAFVAFI